MSCPAVSSITLHSGVASVRWRCDPVSRLKWEVVRAATYLPAVCGRSVPRRRTAPMTICTRAAPCGLRGVMRPMIRLLTSALCTLFGCLYRMLLHLSFFLHFFLAYLPPLLIFENRPAGRWKPGCQIVGSVTIFWLITKADDQSSLHWTIHLHRLNACQN